MSIPDDRKYSETHEWYKVEGDVVLMGITQFAADELTDITYVELPEEGEPVKAGDPCGEVESVKATSELMCHLDGEVAARNEQLEDQPEMVNEDAFSAWLLKIKAGDLSALEKLMDAGAYGKHIAD